MSTKRQRARSRWLRTFKQTLVLLDGTTDRLNAMRQAIIAADGPDKKLINRPNTVHLSDRVKLRLGKEPFTFTVLIWNDVGGNWTRPYWGEARFWLEKHIGHNPDVVIYDEVSSFTSDSLRAAAVKAGL